MRHLSRVLVAALTSLLLALGFFSPALADTPTLTQEQEQSLRSNMTSLGIDSSTQASLIAKIEAGVAPDSLDPASVPVTVIPIDTAAEEGELRIFADGSRSKTVVVKTAPAASTPNVDGMMRAAGGSISKCSTKTFSGGSSQSGCLVKMSTIAYVGQFNANYTLVNGGQSYISSAYNWSCFGFGCTIENTGIVKKKADLNGPAKAEMRVRVSAGPIATTGYLQLFVKGPRAWTN